MARPARPLIGPGWLWGIIWFFLKPVAFLFIFVWIRATVPRVRYDQLMDLGWKVLIPLSLGWLLAARRLPRGPRPALEPGRRRSPSSLAAIGLAFYGLLRAGDRPTVQGQRA